MRMHWTGFAIAITIFDDAMKPSESMVLKKANGSFSSCHAQSLDRQRTVEARSPSIRD